MAVYEFKFTADLGDKDPDGLRLLHHQFALAMVPQVGGSIVEDASVSELLVPKKGKAKK